MDEHEPLHTTRRAALRGIGMAAGAAALGTGIDWSSAGAEGIASGPTGSDGEPLREESPQRGMAPSSVTAGLTYATFGMFAFKPNIFSNGYQVSGTGAYSNLSEGYLVANLPLPTGAVIKEVQFVGTNNGSGAREFRIERYPLVGGGGQSAASVMMPSMGSSLQTVTTTPYHLVDADYSYDAAVLTSSDVRIYSCRVGYTGSLGFFRVDPQVRKLDTRLPGPLSGRFLAGQTRAVTLTPELPAGAAAALVNVTVTNTVNGGFLTLFPALTSNPGTSSINWFGSGQTIANNATVAVSGLGQINVYCGGAGGPQADVIVDLLGYYR